MIPPKIILSLFFCISLSILNGQTIRALEKAGDEAMASNDYFAAIVHYGDILSLKQDRMDIYYKYGLAANSFNAFELAEKSFEKVASTEIEDKELSEELSNVKFWLGDTQKKLGKYGAAILSFKDFIKDANSTDPLDQQLAKIAAKQIEDCMWAEERMGKMDNHYTITHLGDDVNTPYAEFAPISIDDNLYFSSLRYENDRYKKNRILAFSKVLQSKRGVLKNILLDSYDMTEKHVAHTAFTRDNKQVIFTVCGYDKTRRIICDLYSGDLLEESRWGNITKLPEPINLENATSTQPNIGYEGETAYLYFVSDREDGKGGKDIWRAKLSNNQENENVENLGSINTEDNDITPFYHSPTKTLYFSSDGRKNMGGFDVYKADLSQAGPKKVEHFGYPLNSSYNDLYFTLNENESSGHISSNRPESKYLIDSLASCCYDLYKVDFVNSLELMAKVFDKVSGDPITSSQASILELKFDEKMSKQNTDSHIYQVDILRNREYEMTFTAEGYEPSTILVSTMDLDRFAELEKEVRLVPLPITLLASSFDEESLAALAKVTYTLSMLKDGNYQPLESATIADIEAFTLLLEKNKDYRITATRDGYHDAIVDFDTHDMIGGNDKEVRLLLGKMTPSEVLKKGIDEFLPVPLYFDNDQPRGNISPTMTSLTYGQLNDKYYLRKTDFLRINGANLSGEALTKASGDMEYFFDESVRIAKASLNTFCDRMLEYLKLGNTAEIMIQGYASPLADLDYNLNLGKRRISSIQNHINQWRGGELLPYVNNGSLKIRYKSYGESEARPEVSDNPADIKNSIYSLEASKERRVEIIEVN